MKKCITILLITALILSTVGCSSAANSGNTGTPNTTSGSDTDQTGSSPDTPSASSGASSDASLSSENTAVLNTDDMFTDRDKEIGYDESSGIRITLSQNASQCDSDTVLISENTITITGEGTYILTGNLDNGQIVIDAQNTDKLQLVLDNVSVNCDTSAAIYIKQADKVFLTLASGSENYLSNTSEFIAIDDNNIDSVIFSKDDLTLNGSGSLTIEAAYGHGIVSKDDLVITGGTYSIQSQKHGMTGKDSVRILDGTFDINSGKDGIHAENADDAALGYLYIAGGTFRITSVNDAMDTGYVLQIDDGTFDLNTGGGSENASTNADGSFNKDWGTWERGGNMTNGMKGDMQGGMKEALPDGTKEIMPDGTEPPVFPNSTDKTSMTPDSTGEALPNGTEMLSSTDTTSVSDSAKGLKASSDLIIYNGTFHIDSSDDALHSNGNLSVCGGSITIASGDDGLHADNQTLISNGSITITKSYEGIEGQSILIEGGQITLASSDDGLNAAGGNDQSGLGGRPGQGGFAANTDCFIRITGGTLNIDASGDGIDSNGSLYVSGGEIYVNGPENSGNGALDYASEAAITGGILVATGFSGMNQNFGSASTQCAAMITGNTLSPGDSIIVRDSSGSILLEYTTAKSCNSIIISSPQICLGETYEISLGNETVSITMEDTIYGSSGGFGGMGDPGGKSGGRSGF